MDRLLKLLQNNKGRGVKVQAITNGDETTIYIYDMIGEDWWTGGGVRAIDFVKELAAIDSETIHLRINSPGGDVFEARAIKTALDQHKAKIITHIDGYAASAASIVALAGDEIEIAEGGFFMIHKAWGLAFGNSDDMLEVAALFEKIDGTLVTDYQKKSGQEKAQIEEWMAAETWFTAAEALEAGFIDSIYEGEKIENKFDLSAFVNTPETLKAEPEKVTGDMIATDEIITSINTRNAERATEAQELEAKEESDANLNDMSRDSRERKLAQSTRGI